MLLGRIDPARLTGVEGGVSIDDIQRAFQSKIGDRLGISATEAAAAVVRVANFKMARAIRMVSVAVGADPRDYALFAFGGAGPLHATALARELGIPTVLIPPRPGITNAIGCTVADLRHDFVRTINTPLDSLDMGSLRVLLEDQAQEGERLIAIDNVDLAGIKRIHSLDMQFVGQTHLIRIPLDDPGMSREDLQSLFEDVYFKRFRVELENIRASVANVNTSVVGQRHQVDLAALIDPGGRADSLHDAWRTSRNVYFDGWHDCPVYLRDLLPLNATIEGPAILEQMDTTILLEPGDIARGDDNGNLLVSVGGNDGN